MRTRLSILPALLFAGLFLIGGFSGYTIYTAGNTVSISTVKSIVTGCISESDPKKYIACIRNGFRPILRVSTLKQILSHVEVLAYTNEGGKIKGEAWCHEIGHVLGEEAARMNMPTSHLIQYCGTGCGYGCIHGTIYMKARQDPTLMSNLDKLCIGTRENPVSYIDRDNCTHGIGHFLTEYASYDLKKSLSLCTTHIPRQVRGQCMAGAIMEMFAQKDQQQAPFAFPPDIVAFCQSLPDEAQDGCVGLLSSMKPEQSIHEGMVNCSKMPSRFIPACIEGKAEKVYKQQNGNATEIVSICEKEIPYTNRCVKSAVLISLNMDPTGNSGRKICEASSGTVQSDCKEYLNTIESRLKKQ